MDVIVNGRFSFSVEFRDLLEDRGLSIHVFGPTASKEEELLRFDCFESEPHYHIAWSARTDPFIKISSTEPFKWAIEKLRNDSIDLLQQAGALPMNGNEINQLGATIQKLDELGTAIVNGAQV